jgi:hypothetical protein
MEKILKTLWIVPSMKVGEMFLAVLEALLNSQRN